MDFAPTNGKAASMNGGKLFCIINDDHVAAAIVDAAGDRSFTCFMRLAVQSAGHGAGVGKIGTAHPQPAPVLQLRFPGP